MFNLASQGLTPPVISLQFPALGSGRNDGRRMQRPQKIARPVLQIGTILIDNYIGKTHDAQFLDQFLLRRTGSHSCTMPSVTQSSPAPTEKLPAARCACALAGIDGVVDAAVRQARAALRITWPVSSMDDNFRQYSSKPHQCMQMPPGNRMRPRAHPGTLPQVRRHTARQSLMQQMKPWTSSLQDPNQSDRPRRTSALAAWRNGLGPNPTGKGGLYYRRRRRQSRAAVNGRGCHGHCRGHRGRLADRDSNWRRLGNRRKRDCWRGRRGRCGLQWVPGTSAWTALQYSYTRPQPA